MAEHLQVVWYKRDLRVTDHAALCAAAEAGPVLPIYVVEPEYWRLPDTSYRQWTFIRAAVEDLQQLIRHLDGALVTRIGSVVDVLRGLRIQHGKFAMHGHIETGNAWTYERDQAVRQWCRDTDVPFSEYPQFGVWRGAEQDRNHWAKRWGTMMSEPVLPVPGTLRWQRADSHALPLASNLGLQSDGVVSLQPAGRDHALTTLHSFLHERVETYQRAMSSPLTGEYACSRLSTHLAAGSLSLREVYQATLKRQQAVRQLGTRDRGQWPKALQSFVGRLHWHCHFIQKLESEPELEWLPMARSYQYLRPQEGDQELLLAFEIGRTGYPFVDACMRYLRATGWINFRMRAMLMSFASYDMWQPWQLSGHILARLFTDYEPGIHWPQCQMQSGETGINAVRIYSPVKQGYDQDPEALFIKRWVPELSALETAQAHEPWQMDTPPPAYPERVVDHQSAVAKAKVAIYGIRNLEAAKAEAKEVFDKHGSRNPRRTRVKVV